MKKQLIYLLASACLLAAGCSTENKTDETGYGTLAINCTADTSIDTASAEASGTPEVPAAGAFSLTVTGETGTQKWDTLTEFEQSQTVFRMGAYTVAIVDWNAPHEVVSGMTTTKGAWDPEKGIDNVSEGKILGYGSLWITQSTDGEDMQDAELDIVWYDHETRPAEGKYSLVISCACNAYGDYFTGCSKNVMYVDDFEWVY